MLLEDFQGLQDYWVVLVDVLGPSLFVHHIIDDSAFNDSIQKLVRLSDEQVAALQTALVGIVHEFLYHVLAIEIVGQLHHLLEIVQLRTVVVGISKRELEDESAHACLLEIRSHAKRILRYEDIWCNTTATINHTTDACMVSRTGMLDAILREELAVLIAGDKIVAVDGKPFVGKIVTNQEAMHRLKGPKDTKVKIGVVRYGTQSAAEPDPYRTIGGR